MYGYQLMNKQTVLKELERIALRKDEHDHEYADGLLCELLIELGHADVVELYHKVPKWFE